MYRRRTSLIVLAAGLAAAGGVLSGCSSTSSTSETTASANAPSVDAKATAFCTSLGQIQTAVVVQKPDDVRIKALITTMEQNAPSALSSEVATLSKAASDPSQQPGPDFGAAFTTISTWIADNCNPQIITVTVGPDNALSAAPDTAASGLTVFRFDGATGQGVILRRAPGVTTSAAELLKLPEAEAQSQFSFVTSASPTGVGELAPGDYVVALTDASGAPVSAQDITVK